MEDYKSKYLKYKNKYLNLKNQIGGATRAELETYLRQKKSANKKPLFDKLTEPSDPTSPEIEADEQEALRKQLEELDLGDLLPPVSPPVSPIEKLSPEKKAELEELFNRTKNKPSDSSNFPSNQSSQVKIRPEYIDIYNQQLYEVDNEPEPKPDPFSFSAPVRQIPRPSSSAPVYPNLFSKTV
jgi:hypothetical protein